MLIPLSLGDLLEWVYEYLMDLIIGTLSSIVSGLILGKIQRTAVSAARAAVETTIKQLPDIRQLPDIVRLKSLEDAGRSITYVHFATKAILLILACAITEGLIALWTLITSDFRLPGDIFLFFSGLYLFLLFTLLSCYMSMRGSIVEPIERGDFSVARSNLPLWVLIYLILSIVMLSLMGLGYLGLQRVMSTVGMLKIWNGLSFHF